MPFTNQRPHSLFDHNPLQDGEVDVDWILIFEDTEAEYWWSRILKPGFQHVTAVRWDGYNWVMVAPLLGVMRVEILPFRYHERPETWWISHGKTKPTFMHVKRRTNPRKVRNPLVWGPVTCVETIKSLLGVGKFAIFTPYQLYRHLKGDDHG
jgi:hypothetical protein